MTILKDAYTPWITFVEQTGTPTTPVAGQQLVYPKSDGLWYVLDDAGVETLVQTGTLDAEYIGFTPDELTYWYDDTDPGNVDDALNELAHRVDDIEPYAVSQVVDVIIPIISVAVGTEIADGAYVDIEMPWAGTINQVTLLADQSGSIVVDLWLEQYADFPPTDADSITALAPPTITTDVKAQDSTLTDWTTTFAAGDIIRAYVESCTTIEQVSLCLKVTRS